MSHLRCPSHCQQHLRVLFRLAHRLCCRRTAGPLVLWPPQLGSPCSVHQKHPCSNLAVLCGTRCRHTAGPLLLLPATPLCWVTSSTRAWCRCGTCSTTSQARSTCGCTTTQRAACCRWGELVRCLFLVTCYFAGRRCGTCHSRVTAAVNVRLHHDAAHGVLQVSKRLQICVTLCL